MSDKIKLQWTVHHDYAWFGCAAWAAGNVWLGWPAWYVRWRKRRIEDHAEGIALALADE